jgi:hypothetical protein
MNLILAVIFVVVGTAMVLKARAMQKSRVKVRIKR